VAELSKKQISIQWDEFRDSVKASTPVDLTETVEQRKLRIKRLEANHEEWFQYYFPKYAYAEPAPFHKAGSKRVLNNLEWYEVRSWSRELAKDTRTMFEMLYLTLTGKKKYLLMVSNSYDNAEGFLKLYKIQLDSNQRIINDYGVQEKFGSWTDGDFTTRKGVKFRAIGAGQNPRGTKNEEIRPDAIVITDIDTDQDVLSTDIIKKRWEWVEKALIGTRSISKATSIIFLGNIIAKDCCVVRAQEFADYIDIINIRDNDSNSTWPQKNTEENIDRVLSKISYKTQQGEYYNNPITEGGIFKEMYYKTLRSLTDYKFLVNYIDLSYKDGKKNDFKFSVLMGRYKDEYHILKCYGIQGTTAKFCEGLVDIEKWIDGKVPVFWVSEEVFLLDIIRNEIQTILKSLKSKIVITPDKRDKGDKLTRIEASLEPLNRNGKLWLNQREKDNASMKILEGQFVALEYGNKRVHDDGPDATEGGKFIIDSKEFGDTSKIITGKMLKNKNRY
jgi:phage terminase large subunit-like protein